MVKIRCSASDRIRVPARPAQHVHRRVPDLRSHATPCNAGRAGAYRPSEALHPTRSSDVLPRIARERVPTVPRLRKRVEMCHAGSRGTRPHH